MMAFTQGPPRQNSPSPRGPPPANPLPQGEGEQTGEFLVAVARSPGLEILGLNTPLHPGGEQCQNYRRQIVERHLRTDQPADRLTLAGAAADVQVVAFDHLFALLDLGGKQADVGDVMLCAGVMATGEVDVHRPIDGDARIQPIDQFRGVAFCIARRELAAGVAGAGDQPAAQRRGTPIQPKRRDCRQSVVERLVGNVADDQVLPDGQPQRAGTEALGDHGKAAHVPGRQPRHRDDNADIVQAWLLLGMHADVAVLVLLRARRDGGRIDAEQRRTKYLLRRFQEPRHTPAIEHVFQPRLGAVGAVTLGDEHAHDRGGNARCLLGRNDHIGGARKVAVTGDAAEPQAVIDAGGDTEPVRHLHRAECDVVGVFQHRDASAAVERDVEFPRQAVKLAMVQDEVMQRACMRACVDQLLRVDPRRRAAGDVADIVSTGAARGQPDVRQAHQHLGRLVRSDFPNLQVGARGDVGIAAAEVLGDRRHAAELMRVQNAARHAQPAHVGVLRRRRHRTGRRTCVRKMSVPLGNRGSAAIAAISSNRSSGCFLRFASSSAVSLPPAATVRSCAARCGSAGSAGLCDRRERLTGDRAARLHARHEALQVLLLVGRERRVGGVRHGRCRLTNAWPGQRRSRPPAPRPVCAHR